MLTIDVFGPLRVGAPGGLLTAQDFQGVKPKQVLEILATAGDHRVAKESLADRLWGEAAPPKYLATLETYVSVLRHTLEPDVPARDSLIVTEPGGYRLDRSRVRLDLDQFQGLLKTAEGSGPGAALRALDDALSLVRGDVLEDEPYTDWADDLRKAYLPRHVQALVSAGELTLLTGVPTAALARADAAVTLNPLSEGACQIQMLALYALWRQDEALAAFDRCRRLLGRELGVSPLDKTVALHLAILRHEDLASMLTGFSRVRAEPPALVHPPAQRPVGTTSQLLAREEELAQIHNALEWTREGHFSVVLVTGETGMGKTSLVEAAVERAGLPTGSNHCSDLEQELPYLALAMALRSLPDGPTEGLAVLEMLLSSTGHQAPFDEIAKLRIMELIATWWARQPPLILVLDDVHWADSETLRVLAYVRRRCASSPTLVVMTSHRDRLTQPSLRRLQPDLRIDLTELPADAVDDAEMYALTGGHPYFIAQWSIARSLGLTETFPPEVCERVLMACWDLGPQAYQLLSVSCVLDPPFSPALLATLVGTSPPQVAEQLDQLVERRRLDAVEGGFRFRSEAVRLIVAETVSPARRAMLREAAVPVPTRRGTDWAARHATVTPQRRQADQPVSVTSARDEAGSGE